MNKLIVSSGISAIAIANSQEALSKREELLYLASHQTTVANAQDATAAGDALKEIKNFTRMIEATRAEVKAPILDLGKKVDALAKELTQQLDAEASRIGTTLAAYQTEQNRIAEELRQQAWREEQRIKREAEEKERAAQIEAMRIADEAAAAARKVQEELAAKAARARTEAGKQKALEEAETARIAAEQAEQARQAAEAEAAQRREQIAVQSVIDTRVAVAAVAPVKQSGVSTRRNPKFKVVDIAKLYEACPFMVKLEPNNAVILAAIKNLSADQHLPGIEHWFEAASVVG